jgi:hypothetical protein
LGTRGGNGINEISSGVRDFVRKHISSVHQLELLLLLKRYQDRAWTASELARELYTSPTAVEQNLRSFVHAKLAQSEPGQPTDVPSYRYMPDDWDSQVIELVDAYRHYRVRVIDMIFSTTNDSLKDFSDAFRLKRPEEDR